jgi:hypothetical protein
VSDMDELKIDRGMRAAGNFTAETQRRREH